MRETKAKGVALGTGALILGAVAVFALLQQDGPASLTNAVAASAGGANTEEGLAVQNVPQMQDSILVAGREVYEDQSCSACHSVAGEGSPRSPLDGVGDRLTADEIRLWIVDPQAAQPGVRKPAFDDLPEPDLNALVAYLQSLTA